MSSNKITINVELSPEDVEKLDAIAKCLGLDKRATALRSLIRLYDADKRVFAEVP